LISALWRGVSRRLVAGHVPLVAIGVAGGLAVGLSLGKARRRRTGGGVLSQRLGLGVSDDASASSPGGWLGASVRRGLRRGSVRAVLGGLDGRVLREHRVVCGQAVCIGRLGRCACSRPGSTVSSGPEIAPLAHPARACRRGVAQVVQLGAPDIAAGRQLDALDLRRVHREHALDADAEKTACAP